MGTSSSSLHELKANKYLQMFSSRDSITPNDPFWNQLLSFTFSPPHACADCRLLEDSVRQMLDTLLNSNPITGNVVSLMKVFLMHSSELKAAVQCENKVFIWQAYNSLFILRCILKYFIETLGEEGTLKQIEDIQQNHSDPNNAFESEKLMESLINALIEIVVDIPLSDSTYIITVEAIHTFIILLSVQMFSSRSAHVSTIYSITMKGKCSIHSLLLVKTLLKNYSSQDICPHCSAGVDNGSLMAGLASGLWNVLTLNYGSKNSSEITSKTVLANQSLLLLLILVNHYTNKKEIENPYRSALLSIQDTMNVNEEPSDCVKSIKFEYNILFKTLCNTLHNDQTTLLTYLLLHENKKYRHFVMSCDVQNLVVPLLQLLYNAPEKNSHLIYMALIILLILTEDDTFDEKIHSIKLKNVSWYCERNLSEISLGSLMVLILTRTVQFNMARMHDKYLHTNCLAALANMSAHIQNLHPYVSQKFINLLECLGKRFIKLNTQSNSESAEIDLEFSSTDLMHDIYVLDEVLRMLLEILNSCLTFQLHRNSDLLYTILYKRDIFCLFRSYGNFQDIIQNIDIVFSFFSPHLESVEQSLSVSEVSQIIKSVCSKWSKDKMRKLPELKFKYVEEGAPEEFFVPYLWSVIFHSSDIYWNPKNILIFNPYKQS